MATIPIDPARRLVGDLRLGGSFLPGTRTEWLPFPCHRRGHAFLADLDPTSRVQYWEQTCPADGCGMQYRFEHTGRQVRWHPIDGLTDAGSPQALPLDPAQVEARVWYEGRAIVGAGALAPIRNDRADTLERPGDPTPGRDTPASALNRGAASSPA